MATDVTEEEIINNTDEKKPDEKMIPQSVVEQKIKDRLKNHAERQQELESQVAALQQQANTPQGAPETTPQIPPSPGAPVAAPAQNSGNADPSNLTREDLQNVISQNNTQQQHAQSVNYHQQAIQEMSQNDPEFKKLVESTDGLKIPSEVAIHLTNTLDKGTAAKTIKRLLTSSLDNAKMEAATYKSMAAAQQGDNSWNDYNNWLQGVLKQNTAPAATDNSPDLSALDKSSEDNSNSAAQSAVDSFVKNPY